MSRFAVAFALALALALPRPAGAAAPLDDGSFREGYALYAKGRYAEASGRLLAYAQGGDAADENHDWALFFLGVSLHELRFSHAAADVLSHLASRKPNARIVAYSLEVLEEITRTLPFDAEKVLLEAVCDQEYGFVEQRHVDFLGYYQGLYDWEHGYTAWGDEHFRKIRTDSPYFRRYLYQKALSAIRRDDLVAAEASLQEVLEGASADRVLSDEARITLARVWYEQGRFDEADAAFRALEMPAVEQARYLLERAWGQYRGGHPEKAMGLLYAFEAPSFWRSFTPEYFLLKSLIYKSVCYYPEALGVVSEFHRRYDGALSFLRERRPPEESDEILLALAQRRPVKRAGDFLGLLNEEKARAAALGDPALAAWLGSLYDLALDKAAKELRDVVRREFETLADDLLGYEEQAHLIDYEVGLDMYQRVSEFHRKPSPAPKERAAPSVAYAFQGEFWNDELDDYRVALPNRCDSPEEWDVFFK